MTARLPDGARPGPAPQRGAPRLPRAVPTRAWLQPSQDWHPWRADTSIGETWSMFLEETRETVEGPFEQLVGIARSRGVEEMHVWSRTRLAFERFDPTRD